MVGRLDDLSLDGVVGHDRRFFDESGALVLQADSAALAVDWGEPFPGHSSPRGRVHGGRVVLRTLALGTLLVRRRT